MTATGRWFRIYERSVDDPKLQLLPPPLFKSWFNLMCLSSANGGRLPDTQFIAFKLRISERKAADIISDLQQRELIDEHEDGSLSPHDWGEWQYTSDRSTERVKRHRETKRNVASNTARNDENAKDETLQQRPQNTETDTEPDTESSEAKASGAAAPNGHQAMNGTAPSPSVPIDDRTWLFRDGLDWLADVTRNSADSQRALMAKWLKETGDDAGLLRKTIEEAREKRVMHPQSWMAKVLPVKIREAAATAAPDEKAQWRLMVRVYRDKQIWPMGHGPNPDQPGCEAPGEVLAEFGFIPGFLRREPPQKAVQH
jgi:hypothetical protein